MRELSATLKTAQQAGALNPLYKIVLTKLASSYTYGNERILPSEHDEEMYSHRAKIVLDNGDKALNDIDLKGYDAVISYGVVTKAGEEYSATAPLSVIDQTFTSDPNNLTCILELEGMPNLMAQDEASESYVPTSEATETVKDLVNAIVGGSLAPFAHTKAFEVVWDEGYDTLADTFKPRDSFRVYTSGSRLAALRRVLDFTANVPRFEADGKLHLLQPVTTGVVFDSEYSLQRGSHAFFSKAYRDSLVFPNRIVISSQPDDDPQYLGESHVDGYDSLPENVKKTRFVQARLESNDQAGDIAEALIEKAEMGSARGQFEAPLNLGCEVFDFVQVADSRQGDTRTGNLGYIHRRFSKDKFSMTCGFGNWLDMLRYQKILKDLETYTDAGQYFSRLSVKDLYAENIQAENMNMVWLDPDNTIDLSKIGDNLDNLPDGEVYARVKSLHLDAGQLKLDENVWYKAGYDPSTKWTGSDLDDLPDGTTYHRVLSAALTAGGLILLDQVTVGTYGLVLATDISAGRIKLDNVVTGTYGLVKSTDISAGHIILSTVEQSSSYRTVTDAQKTDWTNKPEDMDDIDNGTTYQKILATDISSGHIKLTSAAVISGEWYDESGVEIDAAHGINIYGTNNALTTRATKTGTIQCYVGTDGAIYAGAGNVKLSASGLLILGAYLKFYVGATYCGEIYGITGGDFEIIAPNGTLELIANSKGIYMSANMGYGVDMEGCDFMKLPRLTSNPGAKPHGTMVFNSATGYLNVYDTVYGGWWHVNRDAGWA